MNISIDKVIASMKRLGYQVFESDHKDYNLNIVGIRSKDRDSNKFNDLLCVFWKFNGVTQLKVFTITTDPGLWYRHHPMRPEGTWIMAPTQNLKCYALGKYHGKDALVQVGKMYGYRDGDKDDQLETTGKLYHENASTYIHMAGLDSANVDNWSAGCQVFKREQDGEEFFSIIKDAIPIWGNSFSYTLLLEEQL